ncbi:tellurite resistance TerB family protein [Kovacikia minuta CCNUW1]|uniref:tellurite resistance TerB family protein n=1 Tax=Kovacikia minuta TaxID=2931930 RepID=UPI001CCBCFF0|nr:tellurite resistance TerB family protein [Kovacikia minuta]UBF26209.1 tellurite resistance TerB family protein [Kovacikia minuta CCNUW1]
MFDKLVGIGQRQGYDTLLSTALQSLPHELHDTAFAMATDIILSDGTITDEEETLLNNLYRVLETPEQTAKMIIEVMLIKNRG